MPADPAEQHRLAQGARIRTARGDRTQGEIVEALRAQGCDVTTAAISFWERGQRFPNHKNQLALASVLGVSWFDLFAPEGEAVA